MAPDSRSAAMFGAAGAVAARRVLAEALNDGAERYASLAADLAGSARQPNEGR
jgi:hypothetical protein